MQLMASNINLRSDRYGEPIDERRRLVIETLRAMADPFGTGHSGFRVCLGIKFYGINDVDPRETLAAHLCAVSDFPRAYMHLIHVLVALDDVIEMWNCAVIENGGISHEEANAVVATSSERSVFQLSAILTFPLRLPDLRINDAKRRLALLLHPECRISGRFCWHHDILALSHQPYTKSAGAVATRTIATNRGGSVGRNFLTPSFPCE